MMTTLHIPKPDNGTWDHHSFRIYQMSFFHLHYGQYTPRTGFRHSFRALLE